MRLRSAVVVGLFVLLEALAALGMVVMSIHGPSGAAISAPIYFTIAAALTWWVGRRAANFLPLLGVGVAMLAAAPALVALLARIEQFQYDRRVARTQISDVRDETIMSATGHPIGVRVSYNVIVPGRGYFAITPSVYGGDPRNERLSMSAMRWSIDGVRDPKPFEPGKKHAMVVELYPAILFFKRDERCLSTASQSPIPDVSTAMPLRIAISDTRYGNTYRGDEEKLTRNSYDIAELYRGVLAEGLKPCT
jgi:hypothetical protein